MLAIKRILIMPIIPSGITQKNKNRNPQTSSNTFEKTLKQIIILMGILSFFGANSQNSNKENYEILTSELKEKYKKELERDSENFRRNWIL